jgi:hypothetical protein
MATEGTLGPPGVSTVAPHCSQASSHPELLAVVSDEPSTFSAAASEGPFGGYPCELTPLHLAAALGRAKCAQVLLDAGVWCPAKTANPCRCEEDHRGGILTPAPLPLLLCARCQPHAGQAGCARTFVAQCQQAVPWASRLSRPAGACPFLWTRPPTAGRRHGWGPVPADEEGFTNYEGVCASAVYQTLKQHLPNSSSFP